MLPLIDYIRIYYEGVNNQFAEANGIKRQNVRPMLEKGTYFVFNKKLYQEKRAVE